jgi:hypothetical protein
VDAGLLIPEGEKRGRDYIASPVVKAIRDEFRTPRVDDDPFEIPAPVAPRPEPDLFEAEEAKPSTA